MELGELINSTGFPIALAVYLVYQKQQDTKSIMELVEKTTQALTTVEKAVQLNTSTLNRVKALLERTK